MISLLREPTQQEKDICSLCKGMCCKGLPGICWPGDIQPLDLATILSMVNSGRYAIDYWEGDPQIYWIRPSIKGNTSPIDPVFRGECIFLTDKGCSLTFSERPAQCRAITPSSGLRCSATEGYKGKETARDAWTPHQELMSMVLGELESC